MSNITKTGKERITITCGEQSENHVGMQINGSGLSTNGFSLDQLIEWKEKFEKLDCVNCEYIKLNSYINYNYNENLVISDDSDDNQPISNLAKKQDIDDAVVLIIRNGVDALLNLNIDNNNISNNNNNRYYSSNEMFQESLKQKWDTKYFDQRRQKVLNKHARYNNCFGDIGQDADYINKKGTIIAYNDVPILSLWKKNLNSYICSDVLEAEGNLYYDIDKCGIGFHGDSERKKVIAACLGASCEIHWQWFKDSIPVGKRVKVKVNNGDMYIMSEKATGYDWKKRSIYTLRHAAGCKKYLKLTEIIKKSNDDTILGKKRNINTA